MLATLRPYQIDVVDRGARHVAAGCRRLLIQGATGAGKGTVAAWMLARSLAKARRAYFIVHRRKLVAQMAQRLSEQFGVGCGVVMAGHPRTSHPVQLISRDTLHSRGVAHDWLSLPEPDLCIVDEAHNGGAKYAAIFSRWPSAVFVGMTATPAWPDGSGMGMRGPGGLPGYQALECTAPTSRLVGEGHLVPVRCFSPEGDVRSGRRGRGLAGDPVRWWKTYAGGRPTVLFAARCGHARAAADAFLRAGIAAEYVDARTGDADRDAVLARAASGATKVVASVGTLCEGVDVPAFACAILLRAAASLVTYLQCAGRIMRPHPGKASAVLIDHSGCSVEHGSPDMDFEWSLDPDDTVQSRLARSAEDGKRPAMLICPRCACTFSGSPDCPECGHVLPRARDRKARARDENLVPAHRQQDFGWTPGQDAERQRALMLKDWHRYRAVAAHRGQKARAAQAMFRQQHKRWPEDAGMPGVLQGSQWDQPAGVAWPQYVRGARSRT